MEDWKDFRINIQKPPKPDPNGIYNFLPPSSDELPPIDEILGKRKKTFITVNEIFENAGVIFTMVKCNQCFSNNQLSLPSSEKNKRVRVKFKCIKCNSVNNQLIQVESIIFR